MSRHAVPGVFFSSTVRDTFAKTKLTARSATVTLNFGGAVGIEPTHKGFAVLAALSNMLIKLVNSVDNPVRRLIVS